MLDTPTWRANPDWGRRLGYDADALAEVNRRAVEFTPTASPTTHPAVPTVINGVIGPRGDGYVVGETMTADRGRELPRAAGRGLRRRRRPDDDRASR